MPVPIIQEASVEDGSESGRLPLGHIPTALLFLSLGDESGQVLFIGAVLSVFAAAWRLRVTRPNSVGLVPRYAIGSLAMFWVIQRVGRS